MREQSSNALLLTQLTPDDDNDKQTRKRDREASVEPKADSVGGGP